jgi:hypothetical protein
MKATSDELINEISENFSQYLKRGFIAPFAKDIDPNLNIRDIEKLLRIHFVLTKENGSGRVGVIDFVEQLPSRLRRIKTTVLQKNELLNGEVRGRIQWKDTITKRYEQNPNDYTLFVCDQREKDYNISENIVLKSLLQIIHDITHNDLNIAFEENYEWLNAWVKDKELKPMLNNVFLKNVYLKRIDLQNSNVTERMISRALKSRIPLYREAAVLLSRYRRLMKYELDDKEAKELLKNTFIKTDKSAVLFELYWAIKIINKFEDVKFELIEAKSNKSNMIAKWKSEKNIFKMYHNSTGEFFKFNESMDELEQLIEKIDSKDNYVGRRLEIIRQLNKMTNSDKKQIWGGRPDILLEKYDLNNNIKSIFIGEVKYSENKNYAINGLKELLEYIALIKENESYVENFDDLFDGLKMVKGALFIGQIKDLHIENTSEIKVIQYGNEFNIGDIVN